MNNQKLRKIIFTLLAINFAISCSPIGNYKSYYLSNYEMTNSIKNRYVYFHEIFIYDFAIKKDVKDNIVILVGTSSTWSEYIFFDEDGNLDTDISNFVYREIFESGEFREFIYDFAKSKYRSINYANRGVFMKLGKPLDVKNHFFESGGILLITNDDFKVSDSTYRGDRYIEMINDSVYLYDFPIEF